MTFPRTAVNSETALKARLQGSRRILISYSDKLGDCIHTLPAIRVLRAHAPDARVYFLASRLAGPLLQRCVDIDEVIPMALDHGSNQQAKRRARLSLMRRLFCAGFDLHVDFFPGADHILLVTALAGIKTRVALNNSRHVLRKRWFYDVVSEMPWRNQLSADFTVDQLAALGLSALVPPLGPDYWRPARQAPSGITQPYIHVAPFASETSRELPADVLVEALTGFAHAYPHYRIALSAAPVARELSALAQLLRPLHSTLGERLVSFAGTLDTTALADVTAGAALHVGCDSGTLHMAVLVGTPTVSWFLNHESVCAWAPQHGAHTVLISAGEQSRTGGYIRGISSGLLFSHMQQRLANTGDQKASWVYSLDALKLSPSLSLEN